MSSEGMKNAETRKQLAACEAILFAMGDAVDLSQIAKALLIPEEEAQTLLETLAETYEKEERGMQIISLGNSWQMCTRRDYFQNLIRIAAQPKKPVITDIMMEVLAIIAYKQPITKAQVEKIRGVKSDHAVNRLVEFDLVQELGRMDAPGRPILFGTTEEFLRCFGIRDLDNLPLPDPVRIEDFRQEAESEVGVKVEV